MALSWNEIRSRAVTFAHSWADESSESQEAKTFWDEFFRVFGLNRRRIASFERYVKDKGGDPGFIDLFWPGVLLAEHKSRGKDLDAAYGQALGYFPGLKEDELPRYVIVSDFARIRVHDLDEGETFEFPLSELESNVERLGFIAGYEKRTFREQDPVNAKAAEKLARLHDAMRESGYDGHRLEIYLVRILFCLFADNTGIFMPRGAFYDFIEDCTQEDGSDTGARLNELFDVLDTPEEKRLKTRDERLLALPYVNGKLFAETLRTPAFDSKMRSLLLDCCNLDWGQISPAIFGSLFQGIMDAVARRNLGAHYTSEQNILKLIGPLFMDELWAEFEKIKHQTGKLKAFHEKLGSLHFFDPACGCGNFLVISYREIRLLELEVIKRLYAREAQQLSLDAVNQYVKVDVNQFHGIEIEEWPAQIAQVAMWLIDHQMNLMVGSAFGQAVVRIPLVKSANIVHGNALRLDWNEVLPAEQCSFVFGNPPFIGKKEQSPAQKMDFAVATQDVPVAGVLDFVSAWYIKATQYATAKSLCAFVSTNSICQGEQVAPIWGWMLSQGIHINFAHRTFRWSNEAKGVAAVHCVIIGFGKRPINQPVIFDYEDVAGDPHRILAKTINPYLVDGPTVLLQKRRSPLSSMAAPLNYGSFALDNGNYTLSMEAKRSLLVENPEAKELLRPFIGGHELLHSVERYCLWLAEAAPSLINRIPAIKKRVQNVRDWRESSNREATRKLAAAPMLFAEIRQPDSQYVAIPTASSERRRFIPLAYLPPRVIASNQVYVLPNATPFHFGILSSTMHMAWVRTVCGRLKSDFRYSAGIVYNNFPWPIDATERQREAVSAAAQGALDARAAFPDSTLADLYDPLLMPPALLKAHQVLDRAVDAAYVPSGGKRKWATEADRVAFLFELYQRLTSLLPAEKPKKSKRRKRAG